MLNREASQKAIKQCSERLHSLAYKFTDKKQVSFPNKLARIYFLIDQLGLQEENAELLARTMYISSGKGKLPADELEDFLTKVQTLIADLEQAQDVDGDINYYDSTAATEKSKYIDIQLQVSNIKSREGNKDKAIIVGTPLPNQHPDANSNLECDTQYLQNPENVTEQAHPREIEIIVTGIWTEFILSIQPGDTLNIISCLPDANNNNLFFTSRKTIIVYQPDYIFDVSEIASCFDISETSDAPLILKKYQNSSSQSLPMLKGNIVNTIFDELLEDNTKQFDYYYESALKQSGLTLFTVAAKENLVKSGLKEEVHNHYFNLLEISKNLKQSENSTEPSFISTLYGLQGRLDLLVEKSHNNHGLDIKDIYELKSGKSLDRGLVSRNEKGKLNFFSAWPAHEAQLIGYDLLLESCFPNRSGSSYLIYSSATKDPIRNSLRTNTFKQKFIDIRNKAVQSEYRNAENQADNYSRLNSYRKNCPKYNKQAIINILKSISGFSPDRLAYLQLFSAYISKEIIAGKTGRYSDKPGRSHNSIWQTQGGFPAKNPLQSPPESPASESPREFDKNETHPSQNSAIRGLTLKSINSTDFYLEFSRQDESDSPFRKGDAVLLYQQFQPESAQPTDKLTNFFKGQVLKATVRYINIDTIEISLRNKLFNFSVFQNNEDNWSMAQDHFDSSLKKLHSEVIRFATSDQFPIYTGSTLPHEQATINPQAGDENNPITKTTHPSLTDEQINVINNAINAEKLYFLEGPPGTGKTKYFTSTLIKHYLSKGKKVLLTSFTNRAVDEVTYAAIKAVGDENKETIIRYGSRQSSEIKEFLFAELVDTYQTRDLYKRVKASTIFTSTISSLINNKEIFDLIDFDVAIVDEAGQISEYYLNILFGRVPKIIFVGDSKQLPPISLVANNAQEAGSIATDENNMQPTDGKQELQKDNGNTPSDINIQSSTPASPKSPTEIINQINPGQSYFTRMIQQIKGQPYQDLYLGMFTLQGRMDDEIMQAANIIAYSGQLKRIGITPTIPTDDNLPVKGINSIHIKADDFYPNVSIKEAKKVVSIVKLILEPVTDLTTEEIGIISPFRKQCALIRELLPLEYRPFITVDTVERFQGSEKNHIIMSACVSDITSLERITSVYSEPGSGKEIDRKLNVALTRSRISFTLIGDEKILEQQDSYKQLIEFASSR